jgi:hypothetical protein
LFVFKFIQANLKLICSLVYYLHHVIAHTSASFNASYKTLCTLYETYIGH